MPTIDISGCRLHFDVAGDGAPVVFIQGTGVHGAGWAPQTDVLPAEFT